jgi:hypothetical protein
VLTNGSLGRLTSPLVTTFGWLRHCATVQPYVNARFVVKVDDDVFIGVPALARVLLMLLASPHIGTHAYFGRAQRRLDPSSWPRWVGVVGGCGRWLRRVAAEGGRWVGVVGGCGRWLRRVAVEVG